jgi:hypothetical protein
MIERVLLVVSRSAATGHSLTEAIRLKTTLTAQLGRMIDVRLETVADHPAVASATRRFLEEQDTPALIIAGGGGGTLRAVIEGICEGSSSGRLPRPEQVQVAALRMGSGNLLAKQFGVPRDSEEALTGILLNLNAGRTAPCCVMRVEVGQRDAPRQIRYAVGLAGFGQFGRVPGDLARWHNGHAMFRKLSARALGVERINAIEYLVATGLRLSQAALRPSRLEKVQIHFRGRAESLTLLLGVVLSFRIPELPFDPAVRVEDEALSLQFLPYPGGLDCIGLFLRARRSLRSVLVLGIETGERVQIRLLDRDSAEFFLDEDPMMFYETVEIAPAGTLAFVPGPLYGA